MEQIQNWLDKTYKNFVTKNGEIDQTDLDHVMDWMKSQDASKYLNRLHRISVPQAVDMSKKWTTTMNKKNEKELAKKLDLGGVEVVYAFADGYSMVRVLSEDAYKREGAVMGHCVGSYYNRSEVEIYSLRDTSNQPHCTIEFEPKTQFVAQIKGKENKAVSKKYQSHVVEFLNQFDFKDIYSYDLKNIESIYFGNYIFLTDSMPKSVVIKKKLQIEQVNFRHIFTELVIEGDAIMKDNHRCTKIAETLIVKGDLVLENFNDLVKLADNLIVFGDIEISDCEKLKTLGTTVKAKSISVYDSPMFIQKFKDIELEVA